MSWFDQVTGQNEYQRQSWRDSFNGGRAAGDLTGNVNRRLDAERRAFQGSTWGGSSTQPSALERARTMGPGARRVGNSNGAGTGVGVDQVATPGRVVTVGPGVGVVRGAAWNGWQLPVNKPDPVTPVYVGGLRLEPDRGWSDGGVAEQRYGEFGGSIIGLGVLGADVAKALTIRTDKIGLAIQRTPSTLVDGAIDFARWLDQRKAQMVKAPGEKIAPLLQAGGWRGQPGTMGGYF